MSRNSSTPSIYNDNWADRDRSAQAFSGSLSMKTVECRRQQGGRYQVKNHDIDIRVSFR